MAAQTATAPAARARRSRPRAMPSISIAPSEAVSRPTRQRASVVFPEPDSPTSPTLSPGADLDRHALQRPHRGPPRRSSCRARVTRTSGRSGSAKDGTTAERCGPRPQRPHLRRDFLPAQQAESRPGPGRERAAAFRPGRPPPPSRSGRRRRSGPRPRRHAAPSRGSRSAAAPAGRAAARRAAGPACRDAADRARRSPAAPTSSCEPA